MSDKCYIQFAKCVKKQEKKCKYLHKCNFCCNFADFFTRAHNAAHAIQNAMKHITNKNKENKIKIEKTFF